MALFDMIKFLAQLVIALTILRLVQTKTADTEPGKALAFLLH